MKQTTQVVPTCHRGKLRPREALWVPRHLLTETELRAGGFAPLPESQAPSRLWAHPGPSWGPLPEWISQAQHDSAPWVPQWGIFRAKQSSRGPGNSLPGSLHVGQLASLFSDPWLPAPPRGTGAQPGPSRHSRKQGRRSPLPGAGGGGGAGWRALGPCPLVHGCVLCGDFLGKWWVLCQGAMNTLAHKTLGSPDTGCNVGEPRNMLSERGQPQGRVV